MLTRGIFKKEALLFLLNPPRLRSASVSLSGIRLLAAVSADLDLQ